MPTTIFENAHIVDGTGRPGYEGHVLIDGDRIAAIVAPGSARPAADHTIDVAGATLSPGFVDMHSHIDFLLPNANHDVLIRSFLEQGVTSVVAGNCGASPAPVRKATQQRLEDFCSIIIDQPLDWEWSSMGQYLDRLDSTKPAVNVAQLVGHGSIRYAATDSLRGPLDHQDLKRCLDATRGALEEGACGLSFGLGYDPGMYSPLEELEAFSSVAGALDRTVAAHLKAYSWLSPTYPLHQWRAHNLRALREMIGVADRASAALQVSHFIFVGRNTWPTAQEGLQIIDDARRRGQDVMLDAFPYTCGNTTVNVLLPYWFLAAGAKAFSSRLMRARCRVELEAGFLLVGFGWTDLEVMESGVEGWEAINGANIVEIAQRWGLAPFDAFLRLAERSQGGALMLIHSYSGDREGRGPVSDVLTHEACLYETDALVRSNGWPNPASVGTFPKILAEQVRERKQLTLEEAVRRATSASAERFGFRDRGRIEKGLAADLVVFDPTVIRDATPEPGRPPGRPIGIQHVFVNGAHVVVDGAMSAGARHGRVLRA